MDKNVCEIFTKGRNIVIRFGGLQFEFKGPDQMKEIKSVSNFHTNGGIALNTNCGEEHIDLQFILEQLECEHINIQQAVENISEFKVGNEVNPTNRKRDIVFATLDGIQSIRYVKGYGIVSLKVVTQAQQ